MGTYLNPGNGGFERILRNYYIDKTGIIKLLNERIDTPEGLVCISRPRRFGKSYAAQMLCAYYDHTCNSHSLFDKCEIAKTESYENHINKYNVIYLDISGFISLITRKKGNIQDIPDIIASSIRDELVDLYPDLKRFDDVSKCIIECVNQTNRKFVFIIDEWDAVIREAKNDEETQKAYLNLLREWFKNGNFTARVVAAAYMTGILPIKKDGSQSAISDFREFSVLLPGRFAQYTGFTEVEVKRLCEKYDMDFEQAKQWYDGYSFSNFGSIYNPYSVMMAMQIGEYQSYWQHTSAAENLETFISINKDGLQEDILKLIAGEQLIVNTSKFKNDFVNFSSKDDVLTLLIHLGYLVYDKKTKRVRIPNEEIRVEFNSLLENAQQPRLVSLLRNSERLLIDTLNGNEEAVASTIQSIRDTNYAPQFYNNEQSLRYVIKFAYIVCVDRYKRIEELPTGKGIADVVFIPNDNNRLPAMLIELKWDESAEAALKQIKDKRYAAIFNDYCGEVILVGINYDSDTGLHSCKIEKINI